MYLDYYGLKEPPFALTPDPKFIYFTPSHKEVMANLHYGIEHGKGLIVVTGEVGTGKTTILRWMLQRLERTVLVAYLFNPRLTVPEFYQHMTKLLDIQNWEAKPDLLMQLGKTLETRHAKGLRTVLIIDEAQGLSPYVLEEIRLLLNYESDTAKYLQVVLCGQPELRDVLNKQEFRQLKQRIALRCEIEPLRTISETENYILERLKIAGCEQPAIFSPEAIDVIYRITGGIPRLINNICDNALLAGYSSELPIVGRRIIEDVAETFDMLPRGYVVKPLDDTPALQAFYETLQDFSSMPAVNELYQPSIEIVPSTETNRTGSHVETPKPVAEIEKVELRSVNENTGFNRIVKEATTGNIVSIGNSDENLIAFPTPVQIKQQKKQADTTEEEETFAPLDEQVDEPQIQFSDIRTEEIEEAVEVITEEKSPETSDTPDISEPPHKEEVFEIQTHEYGATVSDELPVYEYEDLSKEPEPGFGGRILEGVSRIGLGLTRLGSKIGLLKETKTSGQGMAVSQREKTTQKIINELPATDLESIPEGKPNTIPRMALAAFRQHKKNDALNHKQGDKWLNISSEDLSRRIRHIALGLSKLGVEAGDRVAIISENRPEWSITDFAILSLGAVNIPIYTTQSVEQIRFILEDSEASVLFVSGKKTFKHALEAIENAEPLNMLVFFDADAKPDIDQATTLEELENSGKELDKEDPQAYDNFVSQIEPDDIATIIYTSGTTGEPKGVMLTHRNFVSNVYAIANTLPIFNTDVSLSVLPLSHIFERAVFYVFCWCGVSVYYAPSVDQLAEYLKEVRPTIMTAVPRLFEKVYHKIVRKGMSAEGWRKKVFKWAMEVGLRYAELKNNKKDVPASLELKQKIASRLVFSKWREGIGGRLRYFVSGGAPLAPALSYAFCAADIPILQGFGMTETCIVCANRPEDNKVGSIGKPFPGIGVKIAGDGEILVKGPNVMLGYYNHPDTTKTVFTEDGWFMTGDVGRIDEDGHLYITDRKKDLFKLSNGKYVAPQQIESLLKESEYINQVVVIGAGRKTVAALVVPDWDALKRAMKESGAEVPKSRASMSSDALAIKIVQRECANLTKSLSDYERVKKVALLSDELSIDGGELTPTLKVKRAVIDEKYSALIDRLYGGEA